MDSIEYDIFFRNLAKELNEKCSKDDPEKENYMFRCTWESKYFHPDTEGDSFLYDYKGCSDNYFNICSECDRILRSNKDDYKILKKKCDMFLLEEKKSSILQESIDTLIQKINEMNIRIKEMDKMKYSMDERIKSIDEKISARD